MQKMQMKSNEIIIFKVIEDALRVIIVTETVA